MWMLVLQLICTALCLKITESYQTCRLMGQRAWCGFQNHYWVPALPHNITHLYLQSNYISEINSTSLRDFKELQVLNLESQNQTLIIWNNAFLRQRKLTELMLGFNLGLKLEPRAFAGLFNLQYLSLYYCNLTDSILSESYLEPLLSLEVLDLSYNYIARLRPGLFFSRFRKFTKLNLKLNKIKNICEEDLVSFRGKRFKFFNLESSKNQNDKWGNCGNPFKGLAFDVLDLSSIGLNLNETRQFMKSIEGTPISHLKYSGFLGKGFSHDNLPDPDKNTFEGLKNSALEILDVSNNFIFALQRGVFSHLTHAKQIDISLNRINQINKNAFDGLQDHLLMLNLSSNLLGEIRSHTFTSLTELVLLDLSHNHIGILGYKAFSGLPNLKYLDLTSNSLRTLGFPTSLPNLQYLILGDNKLKSFSGIYEFSMNSILVDITENRLTNMEDVYVLLTHFKRLQNLFYGGNIIKWCTLNKVYAVPLNNSLKVLDLHDSSLQIVWAQGKCLDLFDHLENLINLNISLNSLTTLPYGIFRGLSSIIVMDLSYNALTFLQADVFPISLKWLHISNNFLAFPDPMTFQSLSVLNLSGNRFHCDCNLGNFLEWMNTTNVTFLSEIEELRCGFPAAFQGLPLLNYSTIIEPCETDDEQAVRDLQFAILIFSASLIITVLLTGIIYARLRGQIFIIYKKIIGRVLEGPKRTTLLDEMKYDAFVCFCNNDYRWVEAALLKKLDNQFSEENLFHCCFEARDFLPGEDHLSNIRDAIWSSRKTLCIVSKEFLKDGWCLEAFTLAQGRMLEELTNVLIMLVVGKVAHYQLMKCNAVRAFAQRKEYLTWPEDPQDMEWFYERLMSDILKDSKVKKLKEDKPESGGPEVQPDSHDGINTKNMKETAM